MMRLTTTLQAVLFLLAGSQVFAAEGPGPDELIQQGLDLRRDGRSAEALQLFQRAHAIAPSPRTFGQMGLVEASLGRWVDADLHLSVSLTTPDDPWIRKNRAFLEQALATTKRHIGDLIINGPAGVEVFVGGKSIGTLPTIPSVHLAEGEVAVSASAAGFRPFDRTVTITPGARTPLEISLAPIPLVPSAAAASTRSIAAAPPTLTTTADPSPGHWRRSVGGSLAGLGLGTLAWGAVWIVIDGNDDCGAVRGQACGTVYNTRSSGWILASVGVAAIVAGGIVFLTGRHSSSSVAVGLAPSSFILQGRF